MTDCLKIAFAPAAPWTVRAGFGVGECALAEAHLLNDDGVRHAVGKEIPENVRLQ